MNIQQLSDIAEAIELNEEDFERLKAAVRDMELVFLREEANKRVTNKWLNNGYG